jgi:hypothetical protein
MILNLGVGSQLLYRLIVFKEVNPFELAAQSSRKALYIVIYSPHNRRKGAIYSTIIGCIDFLSKLHSIQQQVCVEISQTDLTDSHW